MEAPLFEITNIGLTDAGHTRSDGHRFNDLNFLNEAGQVVGHGRRYNGATEIGQSAWFYNGSSTVEIGLTDAAHTSSDGRQYVMPNI